MSEDNYPKQTDSPNEQLWELGYLNNKSDISFNPNIPAARHLTSTGLIKEGFVFFDKEYLEKGQGWRMVYKKGNDFVSYNGVSWLLNGKKINYFEDLPK